VLGDVVKGLVSQVLVFGFGAVLGFRFHGSVLAVAAGFGLILLFSVAVCWISTLIGLLAPSTEAVSGLAVVLILPLTFGSNVFVPTAKLPGWLQAWVSVNPVTQVADAVRGLMLDEPIGSAGRNALLWTVGIVAVFAPIAVLTYRRR
jgi:oleandomycin transport system permease protein